jgi:hypothetical protein
MAKNFKKEFQFPGYIFVDPHKQLYKALGCKRGAKRCFSRKTFTAARQAYSQGFKQGPVQGDSL